MTKSLHEANAKLLAKRKDRRKALAAMPQKPEPSAIGRVICLPSASADEEVLDLGTCEKHGCALRGYRGHRYCPECIIEDQEAQCQQMREADREQAQRRRQAEFEGRFAAVQIGRRFRGKTWADYRPTCTAAEQVKRTCQEIGREFAHHLAEGTNWLFLGECGTGKNMLSALIAQDVVQSGHTALHTTAAKLVRRIRGTWGGHGSEEEAIAQFVQPDLLIIDEVGVQAGSDTEQRLLTEVINDRYEAMRPTICISNHTVGELEACLGARAMDRFYEGESRVLVFDWESWRRRR